VQLSECISTTDGKSMYLISLFIASCVTMPDTGGFNLFFSHLVMPLYNTVLLGTGKGKFVAYSF